ncbi:WD repeat-containing protein wdr-5.3-like isoform X2 [Chelonus insularis]|uniref:WD repeat-containing protein wdr-5.3-like isoform X2 n=1 Tax=Chelonus insularis TaxID=460826 RepID=UPI001588FFD4|nr:WD repeat-containing protein wdr-5.3-like isoform X2 [Chelonus insularis]
MNNDDKNKIKNGNNHLSKMDSKFSFQDNDSQDTKSDGNRRVSEAEMQKRHKWLQKTRINSNNEENRAKISYQVRFPDNFNGLHCVKYSPDGGMIVSSFGTGTIQIRNGETGKLRATLRNGLDTMPPVMCCCFNPLHQNILYASSACGNIFLCTINTNQLSRFIEEPKNEINTIDVSANGRYIVSGGKDAALRLYDAESAKLITIYKENEVDLTDNRVGNYHRMRIFTAKFHHSYVDLIVTGGWDDTVRIWDTRINTGSIKVIKGPHICGDAVDMKDSHIITGSWVVRGSLQLWDITTCKLIETIMPVNRPTSLDGEFLYALQYFNGDPEGGHVVAGGSGTGALEIINIKEKKVVGKFEVTKAITTLDSFKTSIVFGGMESVIRIADYS